jgi:hypothetical protein
MRVLAVFVLTAALVACASSTLRPTAFVPRSLQDCPNSAGVPRSLPPVVGPAALRGGFERTEAARARDHMAAVECRRTLHEVIAIIADFNEQQRQSH